MRLGSDSEGHDHARGAEVLGLAFAGIRFEIEAAPALLDRVSTLPQLELLEPSGGASAALCRPALQSSVSVQLRLRESAAPGAAALGGRDIAWHWDGERGRAVTLQSRADWRAVGTRLYAEAEICGTRRAAEGLLTALAAAALHRAGGAVLHAASVELPCGVVAFVGPSGAGKSTACRLVAGAAPFSIDRLAVLPAAEGWLAAPLPGGTGVAPAGERTAARGKRLALVLRVRHAHERTRLAELTRAQAVATLRACAFHAGTAPHSELELLANLEQLASAVPVADLELLLGAPLEPLLRARLESAEVSARTAPPAGSRSRDVAA